MTPQVYPLFSVTGLEMEYMIVDKQSLDIRPICDELLRMVTGEICGDYENGRIAWSNELVLHVVELKTNGPIPMIAGIDQDFHHNVLQINRLLADLGAVLMPTGAHPWMNPLKETRIWPHEHNEIYSLYNRIFDCRGHGWSNLQSMHINLPFSGNEEFLLLHSAIRLLLPLLPALTASTPILDGRPTGYLDSRMEKYLHNQKKIPSIAGRIIPEYVSSEAGYHELVFHPIMRDIRPYDQENIFDKYFLNSRGAIARFDRGAIEIRVLDLQESPAVDTAVAEFIHEALKWLIEEFRPLLTEGELFSTERLADIFIQTIRHAEHTLISDPGYLAIWGVERGEASAREPLLKLLSRIENQLSPKCRQLISRILEEGTLASRILRRCGMSPTAGMLHDVYSALVDSLEKNSFFEN